MHTHLVSLPYSLIHSCTVWHQNSGTQLIQTDTHTHTHTHTHARMHAHETRIKLFSFIINSFYCSTLLYISVRLTKIAMKGIQLISLNFFFIVVPCILILLKFLSPINAPLYYTYKMLKYTVKISHDCSYMFWSTWTIIREPMPNLAKVTILWR